MKNELERDLGEQPIARIMSDQGVRSRDLVEISTDHLTYKMVSRACKGRRLTPNVQSKILHALNAFTRKEFSLEELFTY